MKLQVVTKPLFYRFRPFVLENESDWAQIETCPICDRHEQLADIACLVGNLSRSLTTTACEDCQFVFLRRRPKSDWYRRFFSSGWDKSGQERPETPSPKAFYQSIIQFSRSLAKKVLRRRTSPTTAQNSDKVLEYCEYIMDPSFKVLDIGCGYGANLNEFRKNGYRVFGIEPSAHRAKYTQQVMNLPSAHLGVEGLVNGEIVETFDLAYSNHVLDHLYDPNTYLQGLKQVLRPGGFGYIAIPNLYSGQYFPQSIHYAPKPSIFTLHSLSRLIKKHGFDIVKSSVGTDIQVLFQFKDNPTKNWSSQTSRSESFLTSIVREFKGAFKSNNKVIRSSYRFLGWHLSESSEVEAVESVRIDSNPLKVLLAKLCLKSPREGGTVGERIFHSLVTKHRGTRFLLLELPGTDEAQHFENALTNVDTGILPLEFVYRSDYAPFWVK